MQVQIKLAEVAIGQAFRWEPDLFDMFLLSGESIGSLSITDCYLGGTLFVFCPRTGGITGAAPSTMVWVESTEQGE